MQARRDAALDWLVTAVPYVRFLGAGFERRGDELTALLPFQDMLIGNPRLPALHGGATAAFSRHRRVSARWLVGADGGVVSVEVDTTAEADTTTTADALPTL